MKFTMKSYLIALLCSLVLVGCAPTPEETTAANKASEEGLKHPYIVGVTEDNVLIKRYEAQVAESGGVTRTHYIYVATPYLHTNIPPTVTVNHTVQVGKTTINQVDVIIDGAHYIATPVEKP